MNKLVIQGIFIFIVLFILLNILSILRTNRREKRISDFALSKKDFDDTSILEKVTHIIWGIVHNLSNLLSKNKYLIKKSSKYEKYILIKEEKYKSPIDYIAMKVLIVIFSILLYVLFILLDILPANILMLIVYIIIGYVLPDFLWQILYKRKCSIVSSKLYEAIIILDNNLAKTNIYNAISKVVNSLDKDLIADEFMRIQIDLSYNISLYQAFKRFYERTNIPEIKDIYNLLDVENENIEETFHLIRKQFEFLNKKNNTKITTNVVLNVIKTVYLLIPIVIMIYMSLIDQTYFEYVLHSPVGLLLLDIIVAIYAFFLLAIKHVVEVQK